MRSEYGEEQQIVGKFIFKRSAGILKKQLVDLNFKNL
jgi:hypothetical protein